jgi:hypothetical protein
LLIGWVTAGTGKYTYIEYKSVCRSIIHIGYLNRFPTNSSL